MVSYVPDRGDIVLLNFNPQTGREQKGKRPALTISSKIYHVKSGLALFCPITSEEKGYPFEVKIPLTTHVHGVILTDQIKSLDWNIRKAKYLDRLPSATLKKVFEKLNLLIAYEV